MKYSLLTALAAGLALSGAAQSQPNYAVSEIPTPDWPTRIELADMNGDGRQDLIIPQWSQEAGRELLIYLQRNNGRFDQQVSRHVEIKPEIVAVAVADVRESPGSELLLFSNSAVFSLSSEIASYSGNLRQLFDWKLIASVPDKREVLFLEPVRTDGGTDLLLPGRDSYAWFRGGSGSQGEEFQKIHEFQTVNTELDPAELPQGRGRFSTNIQINERDGIVLEVQARSTSSFDGFLNELGSSSSEDTLLRSSHWMPPAATTRMAENSRHDIVYLNIGNDLRGQVNILVQNADGTFPDSPTWQGPIDTRGDILLLDFNGDGLTDIVRIIDSSNEWDVHFHANRGGRFALERPDQIMRFSGYDLNLAVTDINRNGRPQLSISYYTIPVVNAIRNTSIVRTQLIYGGTGSREGPAFNTRPDFKLDESFSATSVRGLSQQIHLQHDLSGNGRVDALYLTSEGALAAKAIDSSFRFAAQPFWQYVPTRTITAFDVVDLNDDGVPDLILYHSNAASILVSVP